MKIIKSTFLWQNSEETWGGQVNFSGSGGIPSQSHPLGETLLILMGDIKIQRDLDYLTSFL